MIGFIYDNVKGAANFARNADGSLAAGDPMFTLAVTCLFTRARVELGGAALPAVSQGWWATQYIPRIKGSRLWTLRNAKMGQQTLALARAYAYEAIAWWVSDGIAKDVSTAATARDTFSINLSVVVIKPDGSRWDHLWSTRLDSL